MEVTRHEAKRAKPERRFREEAADRQNESVEANLDATMPLQMFSTDEPGGDPYNHTGRFKRIYR